LGPIYLYSAYDYLKETQFSAQTVKKLVISVLSALLFMILLILPFTQKFNLLPVFQQFYNTLDSYAYGSVNAYNFFTFIGGNWQPLDTAFLGVQYTIWGIIFVLLIVAGSLYALFKTRNTWLIAAALYICMFMFSIKMHERYLFPALVFLLIAYFHNRDKRLLYLYGAFSATFFFNCADVLRMIKNGNQLSVIQNTAPVISFINLVLVVYLLYMLACKIKRNKTVSETGDGETWEVTATVEHGFFNLDAKPVEKNNAVSEELPPKPLAMTLHDYILLLSLILAYTILAFFRLGDTQAPQTVWTPAQGDVALLDLGEVKYISRFQFMMGARHDKPFMLYASQDGQVWDYDRQIPEASVFAWTDIPMDIEARYIEVIPFGEGLRIQEAVVRGAEGQILPIAYTSQNAAALTDEQSLVPEYADYLNGTYFDEIYHARTGYEFAYGLEVYENTHPPLGKDLIALSIRFFGMTPFAWRLPGVLFGIFMIPLLYFFAREVFASNRWAFFSAFIFTFDFMHFAQTRIATIDTYVTFFVIAMYFFMFKYTRALKREEIAIHWLGLCGACMGLAIASKWQGVYGALGLPVLFFPALYGLFKKHGVRNAAITLVCCAGFFIIIPIGIYMLSYIPFVLASGGGARTIWDNQQQMYWYHSTLVSEHAFASAWWQWPLIIRPIYYYANTVSDTLRQGISSFGNPAVWWGGIIATVYAVYTLRRRFDYTLVFLLVAYAAQYLPWVLVGRLTYIYHYFPSVPFVVMLIVYSLKNGVANPVNDPQNRRIVWVYAYAVLTAALFLLFYPVLSGLPFPVAFVHTFLRWLPGWVLM
jgi:predicted membrane-bound dolichyl-phosphate-mannose-protein mannosyltransferase